MVPPPLPNESTQTSQMFRSDGRGASARGLFFCVYASLFRSLLPPFWVAVRRSIKLGQQRPRVYLCAPSLPHSRWLQIGAAG